MSEDELARERRKLAELQRTQEEDSKRLRKRAEAALAASQRRLQEVTEEGLRLIEDPLHSPVDSVNDIKFLPDGRLAGQVRMLYKYVDGQGHAIYTAEHKPFDQIRSLRDKVVVQGEAFNGLSDEEKAGIREGGPEAQQPFQDFLRSEALGRRFEELKVNPPRPFGNR